MAYKFLVPIHKKFCGEYMLPADEKFNTYITMMLIKIEHAFGILKEQFYSLKSVPIRIRRRSDMEYVNYWITICVVLNNFLLEKMDVNDFISMKQIWDKKEEEEYARLRQELEVMEDCERGSDEDGRDEEESDEDIYEDSGEEDMNEETDEDETDEDNK